MEQSHVLLWGMRAFLRASLSLCLSESAFVFLSRFLLQELISVFRSWRDDLNRFSRASAHVCSVRQRVACVWPELSLMLFYCTNGLINTHRERQQTERDSSFSPSFTHTVYSLIHSVSPSLSILFTYSFIYFMDTHLLTLNWTDFFLFKTSKCEQWLTPWLTPPLESGSFIPFFWFLLYPPYS